MSTPAASTRQPLPHRRHQITERVLWAVDPDRGESTLTVSAGLDPTSLELKEIFLRPEGQVGSERDFLLDDVAVIISRALQCGDTVKAMAAGMGRKPDGVPASLVGAALDALTRIEAQIRGEPEPTTPQPTHLIHLNPDAEG